MKQLQLTSVGGLVAAAVAVVASSCCAIPLALAAMGVSTGVVGLLGPLHEARPVLLALTAALLGAGWITAIRRRSRRAYLLLGMATALSVVALSWQAWDPMLEHVVVGMQRG